jgi:hypothetical protein
MKTNPKETFWQVIAASRQRPFFVHTTLAENSDSGQPDQILMQMIDGFFVLQATGKLFFIILKKSDKVYL